MFEMGLDARGLEFINQNGEIIEFFQGSEISLRKMEEYFNDTEHGEFVKENSNVQQMIFNYYAKKKLCLMFEFFREAESVSVEIKNLYGELVKRDIQWIGEFVRPMKEIGKQEEMRIIELKAIFSLKEAVEELEKLIVSESFRLMDEQEKFYVFIHQQVKRVLEDGQIEFQKKLNKANRKRRQNSGIV